jgi:hypothetical protein
MLAITEISVLVLTFSSIKLNQDTKITNAAALAIRMSMIILLHMLSYPSTCVLSLATSCMITVSAATVAYTFIIKLKKM